MWDSHAFGTWQASNTDTRLVSSFAWEYPPKTPGFALHLAARLPETDYDGIRYDTPTHSLSIVWFSLTPDTLAAAVNEAVNAIAPGVTWSFSAAGSAKTLSTQVIDASASEPYACVVDGRPGTAVTFSITTTPGWRATETGMTPAGASNIPWVYSLTGILGSMPCPMRLSHTFDQATAKQAIACRRAPGGTTGFMQDYAGVADAAASGGACAQLTMAAAFATIGAPATLDTNLYRGWYMTAVRVKQPDATPGDTTYRALVTTTGSGVAESSTFPTEAVPATVQNLYEIVYLGPFPIPAGPVPDVSTGSGYGPETAQITQATDDGTGNATNSAGFPFKCGQSFLGIAMMMTAFEYTIDTAPSNVTGWRLELRTGSSMFAGTVRQSVPASVTVGVHKVVLSTPLTAGATYVCGIVAPDTAAYTVGFAHSTASTYADGAVDNTNLVSVPSGDLVFKVYGRLPLGFNTTVAIQAANAGAGTVALDTVALIPYDEWSVIAGVDCAATEGVMLDVPGDSPDDVTAYLTKTDGSIGPVSQSLVDWQGLPLLWPGDSAIIVAGQTPGNAAPTGGDLSVAYRPTYQTPYGG